ncbi:MAG: restriction endonuclease subunit M, partial [Patescibacteria group bacterium]
MPAPREVKELVQRFQRDHDIYTNPHFNETETRIQFLNPLFKALGWDMDNSAGYAEAYKDIIHEDALKIGGATKAPDYCFRIGGTRKFFLEAKKPAVDIESNPEPSYQLRRYAWSAKLPISILCNFAAMAIYDCRARPDKEDKASKSRIHYWNLEDYLTKWDEIENIFSKESILRGSFDKYAQTARNKHGTAAVDTEFLLEIESWRDALA